MNREELERMYGSTPEGFSRRVTEALAGEGTRDKQKARGWRRAPALALALALVAAAALAAVTSQVAEYYGWFYGADKRQELLEGDIAQPAQSLRLGDVVYTLDEVVYIDDGLYGVGHITAAEGANVVLLAEDYAVTDAAGYGLYYGEESLAPEGAETYAEAAARKGAKILLVKAVAEAVGVDGGDILTLPSVGYSLMPQRDGSVLFSFELPTGVAVVEGQTYAIRLYVSCWEVTPEGEWLREEPNDTYQGQEWTVTAEPKPAGKGE